MSEAVQATQVFQGFSDDSPEYNKLLSDAKIAFRDANRVFDAAQAAYKTAENTVNAAASTNFKNRNELNQKAEDDADAAWKTAADARDAAFDKREIALKHYNFVAPEALGDTPSAKRSRKPQDIVKQIQTELGMTDVDGIWGKQTDAAWAKWLDANNNITFINNKTIEDLKKSWAENSKYIKMINNYGKMNTSSGTVENMLEFIKYAEMEAVRSPGSQPVASTPTAETKPMNVVAQGYNEIIAYANAQAIEALRIGDEALHDEWQAHADSVRTRQSQDTVIKSVAAASAKLDKELAFLKKIGPDDTFEFSDSALPEDKDTAIVDVDKDDDKTDLSESRWLRLAGLLKG